MRHKGSKFLCNFKCLHVGVPRKSELFGVIEYVPGQPRGSIPWELEHLEKTKIFSKIFHNFFTRAWFPLDSYDRTLLFSLCSVKSLTKLAQNHGMIEIFELKHGNTLLLDSPVVCLSH